MTRVSLHTLGVVCGLAAASWLAAAEAPTKLVTAGFSPFVISLGMVAGVFVARWTVPVAIKGTAYVFADLREKPHLVVWAVLAGMLWAVANTLTVFAIRNVGLSIAFPLWNINSLVGLFWGWLLFNELRGAGWARVVGGAAAIVGGACLLAYATSQKSSAAPGGAALGIAAALTAGLLWGTMYIPYRKAYISGMNPLSFVTVFTFGELGTVWTLAVVFDGGVQGVICLLYTSNRGGRAAGFIVSRADGSQDSGVPSKWNGLRRVRIRDRKETPDLHVFPGVASIAARLRGRPRR